MSKNKPVDLRYTNQNKSGERINALQSKNNSEQINQ